jgi:hypothetical protein
MNKTETGEIRRSHVRSRMYQPAAMLVHGIASMPMKCRCTDDCRWHQGRSSPDSWTSRVRQMDSFDVSGRVPHAPRKNLPGVDLDPVAIHHEYVDFQGTDFDYGGVTYSCIRCQMRVDGDNIIRR